MLLDDRDHQSKAEFVSLAAQKYIKLRKTKPGIEGHDRFDERLRDQFVITK